MKYTHILYIYIYIYMYKKTFKRKTWKMKKKKCKVGWNFLEAGNAYSGTSQPTISSSDKHSPTGHNKTVSFRRVIFHRNSFSLFLCSFLLTLFSLPLRPKKNSEHPNIPFVQRKMLFPSTFTPTIRSFVKPCPCILLFLLFSCMCFTSTGSCTHAGLFFSLKFWNFRLFCAFDWWGVVFFLLYEFVCVFLLFVPFCMAWSSRRVELEWMFEIGGALCWVVNGDGFCPSFGSGLIAF